MSDTIDTLAWTTVAGAVPARRARVTEEQWLATASELRGRRALLVALWASDERDRKWGHSSFPSVQSETGHVRAGNEECAHFLVRAAYRETSGLSILELPVAAEDASYPSLALFHPVATRMERTARDLLGVRATGGDARP